MNKKKLAASIKRGRRKQQKAINCGVTNVMDRIMAAIDAAPLDEEEAKALEEERMLSDNGRRVGNS